MAYARTVLQATTLKETCAIKKRYSLLMSTTLLTIVLLAGTASYQQIVAAQNAHRATTVLEIYVKNWTAN